MIEAIEERHSKKPVVPAGTEPGGSARRGASCGASERDPRLDPLGAGTLDRSQRRDRQGRLREKKDENEASRRGQPEHGEGHRPHPLWQRGAE